VAGDSANVELLRDSERETGWWLMVGGSEQSFIDTADPLHLEFEYVQIIADVISATFEAQRPLTVLHLGGGLCTLPRWVAARHPGSSQRIAEHSKEIAGLAKSLGIPSGARIVLKDAAAVLSRARRGSADLIVCDLYDGPETVRSLFTTDALRRAQEVLTGGGLYVCNLSDATPFALSRVVAATLRDVYGEVVLLAEPPVLRGRRSGNIVLAATDAEIPLDDLTRRASSGVVRARVVADDDLADFAGNAAPAQSVDQLPASGESGNRHFPKL
jgi:spermidine synthase